MLSLPFQLDELRKKQFWMGRGRGRRREGSSMMKRRLGAKWYWSSVLVKERCGGSRLFPVAFLMISTEFDLVYNWIAFSFVRFRSNMLILNDDSVLFRHFTRFYWSHCIWWFNACAYSVALRVTNVTITSKLLCRAIEHLLLITQGEEPIIGKVYSIWKWGFKYV